MKALGYATYVFPSTISPGFSTMASLQWLLNEFKINKSIFKGKELAYFSWIGMTKKSHSRTFSLSL
jgi:hypothetical protein